MNKVNSQNNSVAPPAMGERHARWGYGYQDKIATERILNLLKEDLRTGDSTFEGVRLADLEAGRVDDFVLVWKNEVEGNSIKWSGEATPLNWGELIGANGLFKELADGYQCLTDRWDGKAVSVRLQTNRPPSSEKHHAQLIPKFSVTEFLKDHWNSGPTANDSETVTGVWLKISEHVGLIGNDLDDFVKSCNLFLGYPAPPAMSSGSQDCRHYKKQFDDLHKAISTWLTNYPDSEFIDRDYLLSAIGFRSHRSGLIQRFPLPEIHYTKNGTSAEQLNHLIDSTEGGYIAVVGPAGIGKSTLVQDILVDAKYPFFIPYYAFLPSTDGNRDRGEALTFFQDVIGRLDKFFVDRHSIGISDVAQGREALREHMSKANEQYVSQGHKTILLIDGLDHVSREINLQAPLLFELPIPDDVPNGFLIILSSQPQGLIPGTIAPQIGIAVAENSDHRIQVLGLSQPEVHEIVSKNEKPTTDNELKALYGACQGNPLILTYLLKLFNRTLETTVDDAVELAGNYAGDIEKYYQSVLAIPLQNVETRHLLGLLCRAAPTIPVTWLQEWEESPQLENLCRQTLAAFTQVKDGNLQFIHNSLIAFLKSETRSRLTGADHSADEKRFHSILAERCGDRSCVDPVGRAKVMHLLRAGRHEELLSVLLSTPTNTSSTWLRQAIEEFLPYAFLRPLLLSGMASAWETGNLGQIVRLILLGHELDHRTTRIEAGDLAESFLSLEKPELAISQVRAVGRLLVDDKSALDFARSLWQYADNADQPGLKDTARELYFAAKPISLICQKGPIDTSQHHDYYLALRAWSKAALLFEKDVESIINQIKNINVKTPRFDGEIDEVEVKARLLYNVLLTQINTRSSINDCQVLVDEIEDLGKPTWRFPALLKLAKCNQSFVSSDDLASAYSKSGRNDDIDLAYAKFLYKQGEIKKAEEIVKRLTHIRMDSVRNNHSYGFTDISYTTTLRCLQELLDIPEGLVPNIKDSHEEAYGRVETTARKIGVLIASVVKGKPMPNLSMTLRSLLLFHNQSVVFPELDGPYNYVIIQSKKGIYRQLIKLVSIIGKEGCELLRDALLDIIKGPAGDQFATHHRRYFAMELFVKGVLKKEQAVELFLSSTRDAEDDDPRQRQESCLEIAKSLHFVGETTLSNQWFKKAGVVSAGAGSHKDYHMLHLSDWLSNSINDDLSDANLAVLEKFIRAVEVAGGDGASEAATQVLRLLFQHDPNRAFFFAIELIDRGVLNISNTLEALIIGSSMATASKEILIATYEEMLSLISPGNTSEIAVAILQHFPIEKRNTVAANMMGFVRSNSLPEDRYVIAKEIQDVLRKEGLEEVDLTFNLEPEQYYSSRKSSLYKLFSGNVETTGQIATRLSNHNNKSEWNPNPSENTEFDWWAAVKRAKVKDLRHLNDLISTFPPPDYRKVDLLAWKSEHLLAFGDEETARLLAEQAIDLSKDGSWHRWLDSAQKRLSYTALMRINPEEAISQARAQFGKDLVAGKLNISYFLSDIVETFNFLKLDWPSEVVYQVVDNYLDYVLVANQEVPPFDSLVQVSEEGSADEALCRFLIYFLNFPVIDIGIAARRALIRYVATTNGEGIVALIKGRPCWDSVQLEHILVILHVSSRKNNSTVNSLQNWILSLNRHESIAVRCIARRIAEEQSWSWEEVNNQTKHPVILLSESLSCPTDLKEARMLVDGNIATAVQLHYSVFRRLEKAGLDLDELRSEFYRLFREVEKDYYWKDDHRLSCWRSLALAKFWLNPRVIIGREATMRMLGRRSLSGEAPPGAEQSYDYIFPIYDPELELYNSIERPIELRSLDWNDLKGEGKKVSFRQA